MMQEADDVIAAQKAERLKAVRKASGRGEAALTDNPRKKELRVGSISEPRNATEATWLEAFGSVTPVPDATLRRANRVIIAAILHIHFNQPLAQVCKFTGCDPAYIDSVSKADKWNQFAQQLTQIMKPSNLSLVPQHEVEKIQAEITRTRESIEPLREKEASLVKALKKTIPGSIQESGVLANIKKIRDLIERAIGMDAYLAEMHAARKTLITGQARQLLAPVDEAPKATKGQIVDL